jgi:hypothetical protein
LIINFQLGFNNKLNKNVNNKKIKIESHHSKKIKKKNNSNYVHTTREIVDPTTQKKRKTENKI